MKGSNFVAIDFETATGKQMPCQVGIVVVREGEIVERVCRLIQPPNNRYTTRLIGIHGITPDMTKNEPYFDIVWKDIKHYFEGHFIVAHNVSFDISVLEKALDYYSLPFPRMMGCACTYNIYGMSLENACRTYNVPLMLHHDGLCDAEACANLFINYLNGVDIKYIDEEEYNDWVSSISEVDKIISELINRCNTCDSLFSNKGVIITGKTSFDREAAYELIKKMGGSPKNTISSKVDIAIIGDSAGAIKLKKIKEYKEIGKDIECIDANSFVEYLKKMQKNGA